MKPGRIILALGLAGLLVGGFACGEAKNDRQVVDVNKSNPRAILAPGEAGVLSGTTLVVPVVPHSLHVYSVPEFAGVESPGDVGIASAVGYDPGERILLPINVNLGSQDLGSYAITLTVQDPTVIKIVDVDGNYAYLATTYPTQYDPAPGFETPPTFTIGDPVTTITATSTSPDPVTGRVNLANVTVDLLAPGPLPPTGAIITFTLDSLQSKSAADICAALGACTVFDAIIIENFKIQ